MNEEYFADGLTEELVGDLSGIVGLQVPAPTSSFYFKGKQLAIADIARQLGVTYVVINVKKSLRRRFRPELTLPVKSNCLPRQLLTLVLPFRGVGH